MVNIAIIGLGARGGEMYGHFINKQPELAKIVAVADSDPIKRRHYQKVFGLNHDQVFENGNDLLESRPKAEAVIIATPDQLHHQDAMKAITYGYHLLLEKPIATTLEDCLEIRDAALKHNHKVSLCHVLRYAPLYLKIKEIIDSKVLGDVVHIHQFEHIGYYHFAHSFVRGNWRNSETSSPIVLAKTCHDLDLILWYMNGEIDQVTSYGNLYHFHEKNAPIDAPTHCIKRCPIQQQCPYDAKKIYLDNFGRYDPENNIVWPFTVLDTHPTKQSLTQALEGPYGRCVYRSDNNVMDHQLVNMRFKNGTHAHLTLSAFNGNTHREIKVMGTHGEISANDMTQTIEVRIYDGTFHVEPIIYDIKQIEKEIVGHGGGDDRMVRDFIENIQNQTTSSMLTSIEHTVKSHIVAFKAETSRKLEGETQKI